MLIRKSMPYLMLEFQGLGSAMLLRILGLGLVDVRLCPDVPLRAGVLPLLLTQTAVMRNIIILVQGLGEVVFCFRIPLGFYEIFLSDPLLVFDVEAVFLLAFCHLVGSLLLRCLAFFFDNVPHMVFLLQFILAFLQFIQRFLGLQLCLLLLDLPFLDDARTLGLFMLFAEKFLNFDVEQVDDSVYVYDLPLVSMWIGLDLVHL